MTQSLGLGGPRREPVEDPRSLENLKLARTLSVGSMGELAALRREEGPRLQFERFCPVIVPPPPHMRGEIRELAAKVKEGALTQEELEVLSTSVATATFPRDTRGQELCKKLIGGINRLNGVRSEDPSGALDSQLCRESPLSRIEAQEYGTRFAEMEFPTEVFSDSLGRVMWSGFISGSLPWNEQALFDGLVSYSGREIVVGAGGLMTLQDCADRERLF